LVIDDPGESRHGNCKYIKEIGRGKDGARALSREQAADLFGQVLDGAVTELEIGAFCLAMRIKGETAQEMAGFLDATHQRLRPFRHPERPTGRDCPATTARANCRC
jgi:anthranilate phosphoribosyltransferase